MNPRLPSGVRGASGSRASLMPHSRPAAVHTGTAAAARRPNCSRANSTASRIDRSFGRAPFAQS